MSRSLSVKSEDQQWDIQIQKQNNPPLVFSSNIWLKYAICNKTISVSKWPEVINCLLCLTITNYHLYIKQTLQTEGL
jgi:hypothetical protein